jgi:hypothetical protein
LDLKQKQANAAEVKTPNAQAMQSDEQGVRIFTAHPFQRARPEAF